MVDYKSYNLMNISKYKIKNFFLKRLLGLFNFLLKIKKIIRIIFLDFLYYHILFKLILIPIYRVYKRFIREIELSHDIKYGPIGRIFVVLLSKKVVSFFIVSFVFFIVFFDNIRVYSIYDRELKIDNSVFFELAGIDSRSDSVVIDDRNAIKNKDINNGYISVFDSVVDSNVDDYVFDDPEDITYFVLNYSSVVKPMMLDLFEHKEEVIEGGTLEEPQYKTKFVYVVKSGDSINSIARKFGISKETILWENKITETSVLKIGARLTILPVSGLSYKVEYGDNLSQISKKYKVSIADIKKYNNINNDVLKLGQSLIIPTDSIPRYSSSVAQRSTSIVQNVINKLYPKVSQVQGSGELKAHIFPYGQCTWYVATKRFVPWGGHAKQWLKNSQQYGYNVGQEPAVGAIVATKENSLYGHVAYVEEVGDDYIVISEMNYKGLGIKSVRRLDIDDWKILGYIY